MSRSTLEWYEQMARALVWAGAIVLLLSVVGVVIIAGSEDALPILGDAERQGRGVAALASLGGGLTASGLLAGVGAILRLLVVERLERLEPAQVEELSERAEQQEEPRRRDESKPQRSKSVKRGEPNRARAKPKREQSQPKRDLPRPRRQPKAKPEPEPDDQLELDPETDEPFGDAPEGTKRKSKRG